VNFATVPSTNNDVRPIAGNFSTGCGSNCVGYGLWFYQSGAGAKQLLGWVGYGGGTGYNFNVDWSPSTNTWYMVTMAHDASTSSVTYYVNGSSIGTVHAGEGGGNMVAGTNALAVGTDYINNTLGPDYFDGQIDELGIWNRALSAAEISQLYNGGSGLQYPFSSSITEGMGQTELWQSQPYGAGTSWAAATKPATSPGSQTMSFSYNASTGVCDEVMAALKAAPTAQGQATTTVYSYPQSGYMNPDAVGSIGNGISTTTYTYDANGNVTQAGGWSYVWDYLNRRNGDHINLHPLSSTIRPSVG
jgi:hypothetical protein